MTGRLAGTDDGIFIAGPDYDKYALYDINGDGIKELLVHHWGDYDDQLGYVVYTWDGAQVARCQEMILRDGELRGYGNAVLIAFSGNMEDRSLLESQEELFAPGGITEAEQKMPPAQMDSMVDMLHRLYGTHVYTAERPDFYLDDESLSTADKAFLLNCYQYFHADEDERIRSMNETGSEWNDGR